MAKTTNYFPHDANMRNTSAVLKLRMKHGLEGYGAYCMILERLRSEQDYTSVKDYNMIAFDLRCDSGLVKSVIEDFGLFDFASDGERLHSEDLNDWMEPLDSIKEARTAAAAKRWNKADKESMKTDADAEHMHSTCKADAMDMLPNANKINKINKRKEKKLKKEEEEENARGACPPPPSPVDEDVFSLADAIEELKGDTPWLEAVANVSDIDASLLPWMLGFFADYARGRGKAYADIGDAMGHFMNWLPTKSGRQAAQKAQKALRASSETDRPSGDASHHPEEKTAAREAVVKPDEMIRRWGFDPSKVSLAEAMRLRMKAGATAPDTSLT